MGSNINRQVRVEVATLIYFNVPIMLRGCPLSSDTVNPGGVIVELWNGEVK